MARLGSVMRVPIIEVRDGQGLQRQDEVIAEEPMEVRVAVWQQGNWQTHSLTVTMRTPGNDFELAAGFLFTEGVIKSRRDIRHIAYCTDENEPQNTTSSPSTCIPMSLLMQSGSAGMFTRLPVAASAAKRRLS